MKRIIALIASLASLSASAASYTYTWHQDAYVWKAGVVKTPPTHGSFTVDAAAISPCGQLWFSDAKLFTFGVPAGANWNTLAGGFWLVDPVTGAPVAGSIKLGPNYNGGPYFSGASIEPDTFTLAHPLVAGSIGGHWAVTYTP
jgi:hypothetical protein